MKKKKIRSKLERTSRKLEKTKSRLKSVMQELDAMQKRFGDEMPLEATAQNDAASKRGLADGLNGNTDELQTSAATH